MNRTIYFLLLSLLITNYAISQDRDGKINVGLSGIPLYDFRFGEYAGFVVNPSIHYELTNRISLGTNFFFYSLRNTSASGVPASSRAFGVAPSVRYNIVQINKVGVFAEGAVGFGSVKFRPRNQDNPFFPVDQNNGGILVYQFGLGVNYRLSNRISLELLIPYLRVNDITNDNVNENIFGGLGPTIGIRYRLK